jgi:predicted nucleic acid-binding protein
MIELLLVDTSAWHRSAHDAVADDWAAHLGADELAICPQVRLEILYSARSARDYEAIASELDALRQVGTGDAALERALEVQRALAHFAWLHHRSVKIADLVIAASAELAGATVWHYDEDFDRVAAITGQRCQWIAPRGSL